MKTTVTKDELKKEINEKINLWLDRNYPIRKTQRGYGYERYLDGINLNLATHTESSAIKQRWRDYASLALAHIVHAGLERESRTNDSINGVVFGFPCEVSLSYFGNGPAYIENRPDHYDRIVIAGINFTDIH